MEEQITRDLIGSILAEAGVPPGSGGDGTLFGESVLVLMQVPSDLEQGYRYSFVTSDAAIVGRAHEAVGPPPGADEASWKEMFDHIQTDVVAVSDEQGGTQLAVSHKKVWKSKVTVADGTGQLVGTMRQKNVLGRPKFEIEAAGQPAGRLAARTSQMLGWNLIDASGTTYGQMLKVGRLYGGRAGVAPVATTFKMPACFVLQFTQRPPHPLLAIAAPLVVDLSMNMDPTYARSVKRGPGAAGSEE